MVEHIGDPHEAECICGLKMGCEWIFEKFFFLYLFRIINVRDNSTFDNYFKVFKNFSKIAIGPFSEVLL